MGAVLLQRTNYSLPMYMNLEKQTVRKQERFSRRSVQVDYSTIRGVKVVVTGEGATLQYRSLLVGSAKKWR